MANVDAFNEGVDAGMGKKKKSKKSQLLQQPTPGKVASPKDYKHGGRVRKSGMARVHRGEVVLTKAQTKRHSKKAARKRVSSKG